MSAIREQILRRRTTHRHAPRQVGEPEVLRLGVFDCTVQGSEKEFELRGEDEQGRVHFRFSDSRRMIVLDEFDATLADLERRYDRVE